MVELADLGPYPRRGRNQGIKRSRGATRIRGRVGVLIAGQLVFEAASPSLAPGCIGPLIHLLNQILDARIAVPQDFPIELQIERAEDFLRASPMLLRISTRVISSQPALVLPSNSKRQPCRRSASVKRLGSLACAAGMAISRKTAAVALRVAMVQPNDTRKNADEYKEGYR